MQAPQSILIALTDRHSQADGNTGRNSRVGVSTYQHPLSLGSRSMMPPSGRCADVLAISIRIVPSGFTNSWTSLVGVCSYCIVDRLSELFVGKHLIRIMFLLTHGEQSLVLTFSWLSPEPPPSQSRIDRQVTLLALFTFSGRAQGFGYCRALTAALRHMELTAGAKQWCESRSTENSRECRDHSLMSAAGSG